MSYKIKFDDITSVQVESQKTMNAWEEAIASLNKAMSDFINNQNLQGQAISSMRNYLVEVHGTLLPSSMKVIMRVRIWLPLRNSCLRPRP